jgi:hypothetical protein
VLPAFLLLICITRRKTLVQTLAAFFKPSEEFNLEQVALLCVPVFFTVLLLFPLATGWDRFFTAYYALILIYSVSQWHTQHCDTKA